MVKKKLKVIAGFPGVGKTCIRNNYELLKRKVADSDSSKFSKIVDKDGNMVPNPDFPENYVEHIKSLIAEGEHELILTSTHKVVLDALYAADVDLVIAVPDNEFPEMMKEEYRRRYEERRSPQAFIDLIMNNWDNFLADIEASPYKKEYLGPREYIGEVVRFR